MIVERIWTGNKFRNYNYLIACPETGEALKDLTERLAAGAGHGGSHPHLVQEFVAAIVEGRDSAVDAALAANYTCAGICAHESAMKGGERISIPDFSA